MLGIQGAFNEFELSMIVDRMHQCLRQKAERGEQLTPCLQATFAAIRRCARASESTSTARVEKVLHDFGRFSASVSCSLHLIAEMFRLPVVAHGGDSREVEWITASYMQILEVVRTRHMQV